MSADNITWAIAHSPYTGAKFGIHLVLSDIANSAHGNEIWMHHRKLARMARTTRPTLVKCLAEMIDDGVIERVQGTGPAEPIRYRLLRPADADLVYDRSTRTGLPADDTAAAGVAAPV